MMVVRGIIRRWYVCLIGVRILGRCKKIESYHYTYWGLVLLGCGEVVVLGGVLL